MTDKIRKDLEALGITGVKDIHREPSTADRYFTLDGRQAKSLLPGRIYICRQADGTVTKIRP